MTTQLVPHNHVAIIGTGFGGLAAAVRLKQKGFVLAPAMDL
jgi:cation diffusion facilitator CzcD-associated flavoprotein CzcO